MLIEILWHPIRVINDELEEKRTAEANLLMVLVVMIIAVITSIIGRIGNQLLINQEITLQWSDMIFQQIIFVVVTVFAIAFIYIITLAIAKKDVAIGDLFFIGAYAIFPLIFFANLVAPLVQVASNQLAVYPVVLGAVFSLLLLIFSIDILAKIDNMNQKFKVHLCALSLLLFLISLIANQVISIIF